MAESKIVRQLAGLFMLLLGGGFTAWSWYTAVNYGYYYRQAVALFPIFAILGLTLLLFPLDAERLRAEHGVDKPSKLAHYPLAWKVMLVVALLAGLGNWLAISRW